MPSILHTIIKSYDEDSGSGDEKSQTKGVYGACGISREIEEHQLFRSKRELPMSLSIISMTEKFQFKVFKFNICFLVVRCVHTSCSWRVRTNKLVESEYWMLKFFEKKHTCPTDFKT